MRNDAQTFLPLLESIRDATSATDDEAVLVDVGKALAAFQETLMSGRTPFDEFAMRSPGATAVPPRGIRILLSAG